MIFKHYRYIILLKILCLLGGWYYLLYSWNAPYTQWGTTIVSYLQTWIVLWGLKPVLEGTPLPWSLVVQQKNGMALHIPWTDDVAFVFNYLWAPIPTLKHTTNVLPYTQACKTRVIINEEKVYQENCYYTPYKNLILLIVLIFIMLI